MVLAFSEISMTFNAKKKREKKTRKKFEYEKFLFKVVVLKNNYENLVNCFRRFEFTSCLPSNLQVASL